MTESPANRSTVRLRLLSLAALAAAVVGAGVAAPAQAATGAISSAGGATAVPNSYIVVLRDVPATTDLATVADRLTIRYGGMVRQLYGAVLNGFELHSTEQSARRLAADHAVAYVEQNRTVSLTAPSASATPMGVQPNPPSWGLDRIDQRYLPLDQIYNYPNTAANVRAYIIDTGIRRTHTDFGGRVDIGYDAVNGLPADDCNGHGTAVAGVVGGAVYGVAKAVRLVPVRVLDCNGSGTYSQVLSGINWVTANAVRPAVAVIGFGSGANATVDAAVTSSINSGISYAVAAPGSGVNACNYSPSRVVPALTVSASSITDAVSSLGPYGNCIDLYAPGVMIRTTWSTGDTAVTTLSSTSMAAAHVAGCAAMVVSAHPTWTPAQVHTHIVSTATVGILTGVPPGTPNRLLYCTV